MILTVVCHGNNSIDVPVTLPDMPVHVFLLLPQPMHEELAFRNSTLSEYHSVHCNMTRFEIILKCDFYGIAIVRVPPKMPEM